MIVIQWIAMIWSVIFFLSILSDLVKSKDENTRRGDLLFAILQAFVIYVLMAYIRNFF